MSYPSRAVAVCAITLAGCRIVDDASPVETPEVGVEFVIDRAEPMVAAAPVAAVPDAWRVPPDRAPAPWEDVPFPASTDLLQRLNADVVESRVASPLALKVAKRDYSAAVPSPDARWVALARDVPTIVDVATGRVVLERTDRAGCTPAAWGGDSEHVLLRCGQWSASRHVAIWDVPADTVLEVEQDIPQQRADWVQRVRSWWLGPEQDGEGGWLTPTGEWRPEVIRQLDSTGTAKNLYGVELLFADDGMSTLLYDTGSDGFGSVRVWDGTRFADVGSAIPDNVFEEFGLAVALHKRGVTVTAGRSRPAAAYSTDGELLWSDDESATTRFGRGALHFVRATGRCPAPGLSVFEPRGALDGGFSASRDGRIALGATGVVHVATGKQFSLPSGSPIPATVAPVDAHRVLVHGHRFVGVFDKRISRFSWVRDDAFVVWHDGASVVATWGGESWRLDLATWTARRLSGSSEVRGSSVFIRQGEWAAWFEDIDGRPVRRVNMTPDQPDSEQPAWRRLWGAAIGDHVHGGWVSWPDEGGLLVVNLHDPEQALRIPAGIDTFGFRDPHPTCGTGYVPPAVGWRAPDEGALYLLSRVGTVHAVRAAPEFLVRGAAGMYALAGASRGAPITSDEVGRWDAALRGTDDRVGARQSRLSEGASLVVANIYGHRSGSPASTRRDEPLPPIAVSLPSPDTEEETPPPALDFHLLPDDGWVWFQGALRAVGRDPRGVVVVEGGGEPVRPTPLRPPAEPWGEPPPVAFAPCPWESP